LNSKIVSTKTTNAIFLAIVLVTGTSAVLAYPSFMIDAQAQPYYYDGEMDNRYNGYGPPKYGMYNNYDESQYQSSYKPDYKPQDPSYDGKDDKRDKSKDSSLTLLKKKKCNNNNFNVNGDNTADFNIGNKGLPTTAYAEGDLSANAFDGNYGERNNNNGIKNNGKFDPDCNINNDNNNNNNVGGGGTGAQGPVGPQGEQGPAGPNQISTTNKYKQFGLNVTSTVLPISFNSIANSTAMCLPGDTVLSGGYRVSTVGSQVGNAINEVSVKTEPRSTEDGWTVEIQGRDEFTLQAIAQCFDNP
jgi:hypothetical protein